MDQERYSSSLVWQIVKGTALAAVFSTAFAVIFSLITGFLNVPEKAVLPVCIFLKTLAILLGAVCSVKGEKGWLKGLILGLLCAMLTRGLFSAISGDWSGGLGVLIDLIFGGAVGVISGMIAVNLRRN